MRSRNGRWHADGTEIMACPPYTVILAIAEAKICLALAKEGTPCRTSPHHGSGERVS